MTGRSPSSTALYIAKKLVFASQEPGMSHLVPAETARMSRLYVEYASRSGARQLQAYECPLVRVLARLLERLTIPGMTLHYVVRKLHIERVARQCLADGYRQMVVLGAGFDTLTQRLSAEPDSAGTAMIEVDHPATQEPKRAVWERTGLLPLGVEFVPCAIGSDDLFGALARCARFDSRARTLFVAEGLLMYLPPPLVVTVFESIRATMRSGVRFAFTFMECQADGRIAFGRQSPLVDLWLRWRGEPFLWGMSRREITGFLAERGFELRELLDEEALRRLYVHDPKLDLADGDHLCVVECSVSSSSDRAS